MACTHPAAAPNAAWGLYLPDDSESLFVGSAALACAAVPVAPRLAVTALGCVRKACSDQPKEAPGEACRLRFTVRSGRTGSAKVALASETDGLALLELGKRVSTWVPLGCHDPEPDDSLYASAPAPGANPWTPWYGASPRWPETPTAEASATERSTQRFAIPAPAPDLSVYIDSDRTRQLLVGYCSEHPSRFCQEAGCRSGRPLPRASHKGMACVEPGFGWDVKG